MSQEEETKFPTDINKLFEKERLPFEVAMTQALTAYYARPLCGPEDAVTFRILVDDGVFTGVSDAFDVDLDDYLVGAEEPTRSGEGG